MNYKAELLEGYKAFRELSDPSIAATYSCDWVYRRISIYDEVIICMLDELVDELVGRYSVEVLGFRLPTINPLCYQMNTGLIRPDEQASKPVETADLVEARRAYVDWVISELSEEY